SVHLSDAGFPGVSSRSGWVGSKSNSPIDGVVAGLRALRAAIRRRASSSLAAFRPKITSAPLGLIVLSLASLVAARLAEVRIPRNRNPTKSWSVLIETLSWHLSARTPTISQYVH